MTQVQAKLQTSSYDPGVLSHNEKELIRLIREQYRFGRVTVVTHDGVPKRIEETIRYESLDEV